MFNLYVHNMVIWLVITSRLHNVMALNSINSHVKFTSGLFTWRMEVWGGKEARVPQLSELTT